MTVGIEKLVRMAGQIAANVSVSENPDVVADNVVAHLQRFWDPRMRANFLAHAEQGSLTPVLRLVVTRLREAEQTRTT